MARLKTFLLLLFVVLYFLHSDARRFGGFGRSVSRSSSRGGWFGGFTQNRGSTSHIFHTNVRPIGFVYPDTSNPFQLLARETVRRPVVHHGVNSAVNSGTQRPLGSVNLINPSKSIGNTYHDPFKPSAPTQRPLGFVNPSQSIGGIKPSAPREGHDSVQKVSVQQAGNVGSASGTQRPLGFVDPHNPNRPAGSGNTFNPYKPSAPIHETVNKGQTSVNNNAYGMGQSHPAGYVPPSHGYQPGYYGNTYHPGGYGYGNNHNNDYSSWYRQPHSPGGTTHINYGPVNYMHGYPSYGSSYHYTSSDTGSGTLGFFLGYGLGRLTSPSYYYSQYHPSDNVYHYDHYTVHHYYHNKETVPQQLTVPPNTVVACAGNSSLFCPPNTVALCMSNGTIMCVAKPETLIRCPDNSGAYCVQSAIPQLNSTTPTTGQNNTTIINIPCISNATLYGNLTYQNNSIVIKDDRNSTLSGNAMSLVPNNSSHQNASGHVQPNSNPVVFCITVIAEPAVKKPDAAVLYEKIRGNTLHFIANALGAN